MEQILVEIWILCLVLGWTYSNLYVIATSTLIPIWLVATFYVPILYDGEWRTRTYDYPCLF